MSKQYRPGQKAPVSGQYEIVERRGGRTGKERTVVKMVKGKPLPPVPEKGQKYRLVDPTEVHVTSRGGLYVKTDELLDNPKVRKKIEDMAQFLMKRRAADKSPKDGR